MAQRHCLEVALGTSMLASSHPHKALQPVPGPSPHFLTRLRWACLQTCICWTPGLHRGTPEVQRLLLKKHGSILRSGEISMRHGVLWEGRPAPPSGLRAPPASRPRHTPGDPVGEHGAHGGGSCPVHPWGRGPALQRALCSSGPQHTQEGELGPPAPSQPVAWAPADGSTSPKPLLTRQAPSCRPPVPPAPSPGWGGVGCLPRRSRGCGGTRTVVPEPHPRTASFCSPSPSPHTGVSCLQVWPAAAHGSSSRGVKRQPGAE